MSKPFFVCYPRCTTCKKAEKWLADHGILVSYDEIKEQNYNLSVSTYVEQEDKWEKIDIVELNARIKEIVAREQVLRDEIDNIIAEIEG